MTTCKCSFLLVSWINCCLVYGSVNAHIDTTDGSPWLYSSSRWVGIGGRIGGSTADGVVLLPNKYLPVKDAAFWAALRSSECPVFVFGVGVGLPGLNVTVLFNLLGFDFATCVEVFLVGGRLKLIDGWLWMIRCCAFAVSIISCFSSAALLINVHSTSLDESGFKECVSVSDMVELFSCGLVGGGRDGVGPVGI